MSGEPTLTKAQVIERDDPLRVRHPLASWLGHDDYCPASRMALDMNSVEGPCTCGLTEALASPAQPGGLVFEGVVGNSTSVPASSPAQPGTDAAWRSFMDDIRKVSTSSHVYEAFARHRPLIEAALTRPPAEPTLDAVREWLAPLAADAKDDDDGDPFGFIAMYARLATEADA